MEDIQFYQILQALNRIERKMDRLDDIANLLKIAQKDTIEQTKHEMLAKSPFRHSVYALCDGTRTVSEIAKSVGKSMSQVSQAISQLQQAGLVVEQRVGKIKYYKGVI